MTNWINDLVLMRKGEIEEQNASDDAKLIASAILDGFAILGYCVSSGESGDDGSVTEHLSDIALVMSRIEDALKDMKA